MVQRPDVQSDSVVGGVGGDRAGSGAGAEVNVEPEHVLFAGERVLWTGRPQRARRSLQEIGLALYLMIGAPVVIALMASSIFKHPQSRWFIAFTVIIAFGGLCQTIGYLVYLLVISPRTRASVTYTVTDRRVIVTAGLHKRVASSAYISSLPTPEILGHGDGTSTLRFGRGSLTKRSTPVRIPFRRTQPTLQLQALSSADAEAALTAVQQAGTAPSGAETSTEWPLGDSIPVLPAAAPSGWKPFPGERLLWIGRPSQARWWYGGYDIYTSVFGVGWTAATVLMEALAISSHVWPFAVIVLAFVGFGLHMVIGRLVWRRLRIRRSTYLVTTQRVAAVWNLRRPRVVSASLVDLFPPSFADDGTLTFRVATPGTQRRSGEATASMLSPVATSEAPVFLELNDAVTVYRIVGAAQAGALGVTASPG